jgi:hypothetical protein
LSREGREGGEEKNSFANFAVFARNSFFPARQNGLEMRRLFLGGDDADFDSPETAASSQPTPFRPRIARTGELGAK